MPYEPPDFKAIFYPSSRRLLRQDRFLGPDGIARVTAGSLVKLVC